ncbi:MAG TPA: hypothetical protein VGG06_27750 [Thermoanaerobaculia bacterium]
MRRMILTLAAALAAILFLTLPPWGTAHSQPPDEVVVTNLPDVLKVEGEVSVAGTIRHASVVRRVNVIVPPADRHAIDDLVELDGVDTDGFTALTMSLHGQVRGTLLKPGSVGAILLPDETSVLEALNQRGVYSFPLEVKSTVAAKEETDFSDQKRHPLGFPRYRIYLYNSTDRTVDAHLYLYLTN